MNVVALLMFILLQGVALVHVGWGLGMRWPAKSRGELVAMLIGQPMGTPMPPAWLTQLVALGISGIGIAALWGAGWFSLGCLEAWKGRALAAIVVVFALRGGATYVPFGVLQASVEPFRRLDRLYFAPVILLFACGFLGLLWKY